MASGGNIKNLTDKGMVLYDFVDAAYQYLKTFKVHLVSKMTSRKTSIVAGKKVLRKDRS